MTEGARPKPGALLPFWRFAQEVFKVELTLGQRVIAKVCVDGLDLEDLSPDELELAYELFKFKQGQRIPPKARKIVCLRFGRGSGKSTVTSMVAAYLALTADVSKCGKGDIPTVAIFAPDKGTAADVCLNMVHAYLTETPSLSRYVIGKDEQTVHIQRPDGRRVMVRALAPAKGGKNVRGRSIIALILDEAEFFNSDPDGSYVINDRDVYNAVSPRMIKGGLTFFISTPWPSENLMSEFMVKNLGDPKTCLCAVAPTAVMRPDNQQLLDQIENMRQTDPANAAREFDCDVSGTGSGTFFDSQALSASVNELMETLYNPLYPTAAACDFAFRRDSAALAIVQWTGSKYRLVKTHEIIPKEGKPLVPSAVCKEFADILKEYSIQSVLADGYYFEAVKEHLSNEGITLREAPAGQSGNMETHMRTKAVLDEGWCELPNNSKFLRQAREKIAKVGQGGMISFRSPRRAGSGHGDLVSAWVVATHALAWSHVKKEVKTRGKLVGQDYVEFLRLGNELKEARMEKDDLRKMERDVQGKGKWRYS